ncbi:hypothetical protein BGW38_005822 [Lunasporangiospora selenospora]|uniref:Uncharacterized protein n=1 Tax=Lunasporangiospora selenospora TaxID=979761 RepID=A0A9P6KIM3_9FUNG|nr:hypothetical protein BGW38_005822 [Lunasporangiospora selenospora]
MSGEIRPNCVPVPGHVIHNHARCQSPSARGNVEMNTQLGIRLLSKTASAPRALFRQSSSIQVCIRPGSIIHRAYSNNSSTVDAATKPAVTVSKAKDSPTVAIVTLHQSAFSHETAKLFVKAC